MIFVDPTIEASQEIFTFGIYYPANHERFKSDGLSKAILNIKYRHGEDADFRAWKQRNKTIALANFRRRLDAMIAPGIAVTAVPPHDPASNRSGIQELAQNLTANGRDRLSGSSNCHTETGNGRRTNATETSANNRRRKRGVNSWP
jgi:hypothetical protein